MIRPVRVQDNKLTDHITPSGLDALRVEVDQRRQLAAWPHRRRRARAATS